MIQHGPAQDGLVRSGHVGRHGVVPDGGMLSLTLRVHLQARAGAHVGARFPAKLSNGKSSALQEKKQARLGLHINA